jgi:hypothetical protein
MPNFNYKDGRPIAKITGGKKDGKILYLDEAEDDDELKINFECKAMNFLKKDIACIVSGKNDEIKITDGKFSPIPIIESKETQRDVLYISGPAGSGKSHYAAEYITNFKKLYPKADFFLFSTKEEDPVLDKFKPKRIVIDEEILSEPINPKELANSLVMFDDIDTIADSKLLKEIRRLRDAILEIGRSMHIYCITTSHILTAGTSSKMQLLESTAVTCFPKMGGIHHIKRFLKEYVGLSSKQIEKILALKSRWVTIYKRAPNYCLYQTGAFLL